MLNNTFIKFIIVGTVNTFVGGALIFLLYNTTEIGYWLSSAISYVLTSILSFFLNKYFTFSIQHWSIFMILAYILTITFSYLIAYGLSKPAMNYLLMNSPRKVRENAALFTGICFFTGINYLGQKFFVFKNRRNNNEKNKS